MKQSLQLRLGQSLTMTPQLQQAIRLLQLSTLELRTEIQEALESNLMLELEDESQAEPESDDHREPTDERPDDSEVELRERELMPEELPVDSAWDDVYESVYSGPATGLASGSEGEEREFEHAGSGTTLREHLLWQLHMLPMSETDRLIGEAIIDAVTDDGFLSQTLDEIREGLAPEVEAEPDEMVAVLHAVQHFDPPGVAARNVQESLVLQLAQCELELPWREEATHLVRDHFDLLTRRDYAQIRRRMKLTDEELIGILKTIQALTPRPGSIINSSEPQYVVPDVIVRKQNGHWRVELNSEASPRLRINASYASLIKQVSDSHDSTYMKTHLQEARWFLKSLQSRNETLLKVASCIVERQRGFLEHGDVGMRAMILSDVAEEVGMHESTISRVTTRKYMHTPRGVFELKYFFSSHVSTADGGECSSTAIRALIRRLLAEENPAKPLSDSKLAALLAEQGINVARRTVAKYREAMAIPSSNERKRLA